LSLTEVRTMHQRLLELESEHRELDHLIAQLDASGGMDELQIRRFKKRKLQIKDQVAQLQSLLSPDVPA